jgi:hypothetical protein
MTKRLQVLLEEQELKEIQRAARAERMTVAEWVRQALRFARREVPSRDPERKLAAIRAAARYSFPAPEIGKMLQEIESGYLETGE